MCVCVCVCVCVMLIHFHPRKCRDLIVLSYISCNQVLVNNTYNIGVDFRF